LINFEDYVPPLGGITPGANVHNKGRCHFTYESDNGETKMMSLWIPAPMMNNYVFVPGVGYRMTAAAGDILKAALVAMTAQATLQFSFGVLDYSESDTSSRQESCIQYQDEAGNKCWMGVPQPTTVGAMQTFNGVLNGFTMCQCIDAIWANPTVVVVPDGDPLAATTNDDLGFDSVETRAKLKFRYNVGTRKKTMSLTLPAIKLSNCSSGPGSRGYRVVDVVGQGIALAITAFYGSSNRNAKYHSGKVDVKNLENQ
jgi:hypothetical protein